MFPSLFLPPSPSLSLSVYSFCFPTPSKSFSVFFHCCNCYLSLIIPPPPCVSNCSLGSTPPLSLSIYLSLSLSHTHKLSSALIFFLFLSEYSFRFSSNSFFPSFSLPVLFSLIDHSLSLYVFNRSDWLNPLSLSLISIVHSRLPLSLSLFYPSLTALSIADLHALSLSR